MKVLFYKTNKVPVQEFIKNLDVRDRAKILACLKNIEELGFNSPRVQFRQIRGKLWEIKIKAATSGYRLFYVAIQNNNLILLHAYKKQSQKAPSKEIAIAEKRMLEVINHESDYIN
jgi:phage-related protein